MKKISILITVLFAITIEAKAQGVGINDNGAAPNANAILDVDVSTNDKGVLIPRLTTAQRTAIAGLGATDEGLTVYDETTQSFWFWDGTQWIEIQNAGGGSGWLLTGNAGTVDGTHFIGTTDNVPFNIRVNNQKAGRIGITGDASTFWGYQAGNNDNGTDNRNTFLGHQAGFSNNAGHTNVATGYQSLYSNTTGYYNTANGNYALYSNDTGVSNTATGVQALYSNTTGGYNTANGHYALLFNTTGYYNTATGYQALRSNTTGRYNTAVGSKAFYGGSYNNSTALGYNTAITASNQIRLGNNTVTSIGGYAAWSNLSDGRFKTQVQENVPGMDLVMQLRPVTYRLDMPKLNEQLQIPDSLRLPEAEQQKAQELQIGFIAQEVEAAAKKLNFDFHAVDKPKNENDMYGLRYAEFVPVLVKALQEQQQVIEQQKILNEQQQKMIEQQKILNEQQQKEIEKLKTLVKQLLNK